MATSVSECCTSSSVSSIIPSTSSCEERPTILNNLRCPPQSHLGRNLNVQNWRESTAALSKTRSKSQGCCQFKSGVPSQRVNEFPDEKLHVSNGNAQVFIFDVHCWLSTSNSYICCCVVVFFVHTCTFLFQTKLKSGNNWVKLRNNRIKLGSNWWKYNKNGGIK